MMIKEYFFTDAWENPGKVYRVHSGTESVYYTRSNKRIYSIAFSAGRRLYFVNANENGIYLVLKILWFTFTIKIYTHSTYVRDIAFDGDGNLYFSEATGAGGNGRIYRLAGGSATLFQEVVLSEVGGFWAGNFCFDTRGTLYISNGNRVPASIYRLRDGVWEEVFTDAGAPIKGLAFLACDLLCYANWRSEIYTLDLVSGVRELVYSDPVHFWVSDIALSQPKIEEVTLYEGTKTYTCDSTCWRDDGMMRDDWDFEDIDAHNAEIAALMADIGAPTTPTTDEHEMWDRVRTVCSWLHAHRLFPGDPNYDDARDYYMSVVWPTIADFAHMFVTWGGFQWGDCACTCKAQALTTLLYRVGIPTDRIAIAITRNTPLPAVSHHYYVVLKIGCHWYYIDPGYDISGLAAEPENVGGGSFDYVHPYDIRLIPGSTILKPMLVR